MHQPSTVIMKQTKSSLANITTFLPMLCSYFLCIISTSMSFRGYKKKIVEPASLEKKHLWIKANEEFFQPFLPETYFKKLNEIVRRANPSSMLMKIEQKYM
jgi:hypothetical protein